MQSKYGQRWQFERNDNICSHNSTNEEEKVILLWTQFFHGNWEDHFKYFNNSQHVEIENCKRCRFITDKILLYLSDAVIFHLFNLKQERVPLSRSPNQLWIINSWESPENDNWDILKIGNKGHIKFNWSMTYHKNSDIYIPYGEVRMSHDPSRLPEIRKRIESFVDDFSQRTFDAVWIASNLNPKNKRGEIIRQLLNHNISVDHWGRTRSPDEEWESSENGEIDFYRNYRFVIAMENTNCEDYISEKAFHAFYASFVSGAIPVVFGGGNYSDFFPYGSYLDLRNFKSTAELAETMKLMSKPENKHLVQPFYNWHIDVNPDYAEGMELRNGLYQHDYSKRPAWRLLCDKLWNDDQKESKVTKDPRGTCFQTPKNYLVGS